MNQKVTMVIRILVGLMMVVFGLNKFLNFMPMEPPTGDMGALMTGLGGTFLSLIGILEIICGVLLLIGKYVPLSLTILIAILFNAAIFHLLYDPANSIGAIVFLALCLVLVFGSYKERFKSMLSA
ncbi:MAG: DoxX family protein [Bacteroidia bacterium]